jgi:hypothetical protein
LATIERKEYWRIKNDIKPIVTPGIAIPEQTTD